MKITQEKREGRGGSELKETQGEERWRSECISGREKQQKREGAVN